MKINKKYIIIAIIFISIFFRVYKLEEWTGFDYDQEIAANAVKSIVVDKKLTLIGQEISIGGIYVGPLYYYLLAPFYILFKMDPNSASVLTNIISIFTILSIYYVGKKIYSESVGIFSSIIYVFSLSTIFHDRNPVPSNPIMLVSVWLFYCMFRFIGGHEKFLIPIFFLFGLLFHFHPSAFPLILVFIIMLFVKRIKISISTISIGALLFILLISPLILFDLRHDLLITKNLLGFFSSPNNGSVSLYKFTLMITVNIRNFVSIFVPSGVKFVPHFNLLLLPVLIFIFLKKVNLKKSMNLLITLWIFVPVIIFTFYKGQVPEYYFMTSTPVIIFIVAGFWMKIFRSKSYKNIALISLILFLALNLRSFFSYRYLNSLKSKKDAVSYIIKDSQDKNFILHIDSGHGQGSGFKYLFYFLKKEPSEKGDRLYLLSIPWSQKEKSTTDLVINNYKAVNPIYNYFGDIAVIKIF